MFVYGYVIIDEFSLIDASLHYINKTEVDNGIFPFCLLYYTLLVDELSGHDVVDQYFCGRD